MQSELVRERSELLLVRPIQPNPGDAGTASTRRVQLRKRVRRSRALTLAVDRAIDDHAASRTLELHPVSFHPQP